MEPEIEKELIDRTRRIETRLHKFMEFSGFDTQGTMPNFANGRLEVPSRKVALQDCLEAIPRSWSGSVNVYINGEYLTTLRQA